MLYALVKSDGSIAVTRIVTGTIDDMLAERAKRLPDDPIVEIHPISEEQMLRIDEPFRNAWRYCPENGIRHCMHTARNIHRDRMRDKRKLLFSEVDAAFMRAQMQGLSTTEVAAKAQQLRDITASPEIEQVQSIEELKELWPLEVLGETPYVPPAPPPQPRPFATTPDGQPLWTKRDYNEYMAAQQASPEPKPEPVAVEDEQYPHEPELPEPPLDLPRMFREVLEDSNPMAEAMRRVEEAEAFDAPLPEYTPPPPEPTAQDVFEGPRPLRKRLDEAVRTARKTLNEDRDLYDIAVMAGHENEQQAAKLAKRARRRGVSVQVIAREIIEQWRGCEQTITEILDISEDALDAMTESPGESEAIVARAIAEIEQRVGNATAYRT